jgi:hypothetical protein
MLFPYQYINHEIEKFQKISDYLFLEVWLKAKKPFNYNVFRGMPELKAIFESLHNEDSKGAEFFNSHLVGIYEDCRPLKKPDRIKLKKWYKVNNQINRLCQDKSMQPVSYDRLFRSYPKLGKKIESFYKNLYSSASPFELAAFGVLSDIIKKHYYEFMQTNKEELCPFCGLSDMKGIHHSKREAYDHFIPKGVYPFNSVNFRNLAPMCNNCNSSYKLAKDPLMHLDPIKKKSTKNRRRAFYPYSIKKWNLYTEIKLSKSDFENLTEADIEIDFKSINHFSHRDQIESWRDIYGIDERYKAKLLGKRGAKKWFSEFSELENLKKLEPEKKATIDLLYSMKIREIDADPFDNANFIKKAFLIECKRQGLLTMNG